MRDETLLTVAGRSPDQNHGIVNPPVYHASTILFPSLDVLEAAGREDYAGFTYGRHGTPTTRAFEDAVAQLEGGYRAIAVASGLAALVVAVMAFARTGDHILVADSVYGPTRRLCAHTLAGWGVEAEFYDPGIGGGIATLFRANTKLVVCEAPGSLTFDMQDIPAIAAAARAAGVRTVIDNTWATPLYFKPLSHGIDISVHAATKYMVGHSDAMAGIIVTNQDCWKPVKSMAAELGHTLGPDDCYLAQRGLRTMAVRLERHQKTAMILMEWLSRQPEVTRILSPAWPQDPGHALWQRDFSGASGLFAFTMTPVPRAALAAFLDHMELYGMGYSWGGYESLLLPVFPHKIRTVHPWQEPGPLLRVHAGLEAPEDLIAELDRAFGRLRAALATAAE